MGHREVYKVEVYVQVRRAVQVDEMSVRRAARGVWAVTQDDPEDAGLFSAPGYERKPVERPSWVRGWE